MAKQAIKLNIRMRSRRGNMRNKYLLIFTAHEPMSQERIANMRKGADDFMNSDRQIAILELPPDSKYSLIKL